MAQQVFSRKPSGRYITSINFWEGAMSDQDDIKRYLANWQKEIDGAALYLALSQTEKQPQLAEVYRRLSASEEKHAAGWEKKLDELKVSVPARKPTWRAATMIWLAKRFGP